MNKLLSITLLSAMLVFLPGCGKDAGSTETPQDPPAVELDAEKENAAETSSAAGSSVNMMGNTTWLSDDGSQVIFTEDRIDWYRSADDHSDNYYSGTYAFYMGEAAVDYITRDLSEYGITKEVLNILFDRSDKQNVSNFVVFDIRYDKYLLCGEEQTIERPLVPWFGFIFDEYTRLDVANMNTGTYYPFFKVDSE